MVAYHMTGVFQDSCRVTLCRLVFLITLSVVSRGTVLDKAYHFEEGQTDCGASCKVETIKYGADETQYYPGIIEFDDQGLYRHSNK